MLKLLGDTQVPIIGDRKSVCSLRYEAGAIMQPIHTFGGMGVYCK